MGNPSLSLKFMVVVSLSFAVSSSSSSSSSLFSHRRFLSSSSSSSSIKASSSLSLSPSPNYKASAADLLSLLGTREEASRVNSKEAQELRSCLKFLVPFSPTKSTKFDEFSITQRRDLRHDDRLGRRRMISDRSRRAENELVWWPPASVMELARLAVDSGGDPGVIHRALDPTMMTVPDVEGSKEDCCELTRTPYGRRFISEELNSYLAFLFELIVSRGPSVGLNVSLNRYDFFHGHLFLATDSGRLGILFHAKEYPAYEKQVFPCNMGYCQKGSNLTYDSSMNLRNILWLAPLPSKSTTAWLAPGVLVVLDAHPGGIIYRDIVPEYVDFVRTIYEDDFGEIAVDVNYLNVGNKVADYRIFIC